MKPVKVRLLLVGLVTALMIAPSASASLASAQVVDQIPVGRPNLGFQVQTANSRGDPQRGELS